MTAIDRSLTIAPTELLDGRCGWSVVDPASVLTRLWYFDGKFLRAEGFRRDQEYVRSLVAISNQAVGHGLVHGFTASRGTGDTIRVEPGLALLPSGQPLLLTSQQDLPIATLVARATGGAVGQASGAFGPEAAFAPCPPDAGEVPDATAGSGPMWVLYARSVEALCGEEERFGQLCEDACATETDRSVVVEGVCFFVERLDLPLPTSSAVTFDGGHLRSRYASAYYAWERSRTASLISGAGLRSPIWCRGAEGVGGDAVALAVFDRAGGVTSFVDLWTARRELMETNPSRYWAWRMARRPRDVFLAQVLQFQCQLLDLASDPGGQPGPCDDEREALAAANEMLASLTAAFESVGRSPIERLRGEPDVAGELRTMVGAEAFTRIAALRQRVVSVLGRGGRGVTGSLLLDRGMVQLPPCGYLPVDPERSVQNQVRAFMGPGVDLRFCAVRPDYIGEAFEEAQHLERISLTQGIDDPGNLEDVDVLVPDGKVEAAVGERSAIFEGRLRIRPQVKMDAERASTGAAVAIATVGREHTGPSWSWALAGVGESAPNLPMVRLIAALLVDVGVDAERVARAGGNVEEGFEVPFVSDERLETTMSDPGFIQRVAREAHYARARRSRITMMAEDAGDDLAAAVGPDRKLTAGEDRPLALWFDIDLTQPLTSLARGQSSPATLRLALYSRAKDRALLVDVWVTGTLTVDDIMTGSAGGGVPQAATITTTLRGQTDPLIVFGTQTIDQPAASFSDLLLTWQVGRTSAGAKVLQLSVGPPVGARGGTRPTFSARDEGQPRHVQASVSLTVVGPSLMATHPSVLMPSSTGTSTYELARLDLDELAGGFEGSAPARAIAEAAIEMIGAELSLPGRDPSFVPTARQRLLAPDPDAEGADQIVGTADWVFFHRRRDKRCEGSVSTTKPVAVRRYRLHHAVIDQLSDLRRFQALGGLYARTAEELPGFEDPELKARVRDRSDLDYVQAHLPVSGLGFRPVATLEFEGGTSRMLTSPSVLRTAWQAGERGTHLVLAAAGDFGVGDGEDVVLGRLATMRGAIADLIDQSRVNVRYLQTIPPEFQESGLDGALFTVGYLREEPQVAGCATLLRISKHHFVELERYLIGLGNPITLDSIIEAMRRNQIPVDDFNATFDDGTTVLNEDALKHWWGPIPPMRAVDMVAEAQAEAGQEELWHDRARAAVGVLGLASLARESVIPDTGDCGMAMLVIRRDFEDEFIEGTGFLVHR